MNISKETQQQLGNIEWVQNWTQDGIALYGEIMELATGKVWLCQQSFTPESYQALAVPEGFIKSGSGKAAHDMAYFRRAPEAQVDGPLPTMTVGSRVFSLVAIPGKPDENFTLQEHGLMLLDVNKHHNVIFTKGRTIEVLSMADGKDYVPQITEAAGLPGLPESKERVLPKGWTVHEITLEEDLMVEVPFPAKVCFFTSGHSFQGPVTLKL